eukprot:g19337.t1
MDRERGTRSSGAVDEEPDERVVREPDLVNPINYTKAGAFLRDSSILGIPVASYELNSAALYDWSERDYVRAAMRAVATGFKAEPDLPEADASDTTRKKATPTDKSGPGVLVMVTPKVEQDPTFYGASFLTAFVTKRLLSGLAGREHLAKAVRQFQAVLEPFAENNGKKDEEQKGLGQTMVELTGMSRVLDTWNRQALFDAYAREKGLTRAIVPVGREWLFKDECALQGLFFKGDENKGRAVDENKGGADAALCSTDEATSDQQEDGCKLDRTVVDLAQWHFGGASLDLEVHEEGVAADDGGSRRRVAFNVIGEVADGVKEDYEMECVRELRQAARRIPRTSEEKGDVGEESESDDGRSSDEFELEPRQSCPNPLRWLASDVLLAGGETVKEQETIANGKETRASGRSPALSPEAISELLQNDKTGLFKTLIEM